MHNKKFKQFLKKTQPNSGFTLTELLTGLFMSIFVTGALGFGLYQIMSATAREKAKTDARNEASRAVEFISDELRRAQSIEPNANDATGFNDSGKKVVLALNIPELNNSNTLDSDGNANTSERVVYYLKSTDLDNWQGPQVLYRWGPPLDGNGNYTENDWQHEALIDGIDDTPISAVPDSCVNAGDNITPTMSNNPSGFYACINGTNTAAQIFLTGGIDTIAGNDSTNDSNYTAQTQAVARAKDVTVDDAEVDAPDAIAVKSLGADYTCNPNDVSTETDDTTWTMRMDYDINPYDNNTDDTTKWIHDSSRQSQPIGIDREKPNDLTIYSVPISSSGCISNGNENATISDDVSGLTTTSFTIKLRASLEDDPDDGIDPPRSDDPNFYKTFNGNTTDNPDDGSNYNNPNVDPNGKIIVLKNNSKLKPVDSLTSIDFTSNNAPAPLYPGYDPDGEGLAPYRQSLGEFLADSNNFPDGKTYATLNNDGSYTITGLEDNQRLVAFEIGQDDNGLTNDNKQHPGFDLQDNIILMSHDVFKDDHTPD